MLSPLRGWDYTVSLRPQLQAFSSQVNHEKYALNIRFWPKEDISTHLTQRYNQDTREKKTLESNISNLPKG